MQMRCLYFNMNSENTIVYRVNAEGVGRLFRK